MRDRLIELIRKIPYGVSVGVKFEQYFCELVADHLLANGVIVPPCKVGQTVFFYTCVCDKEGEERFDILEGEVVSFSLQKEGLWGYCRYKCGLTYWHLVEKDFGKEVFLTREEAKAKMKGGEG